MNLEHEKSESVFSAGKRSLENPFDEVRMVFRNSLQAIIISRLFEEQTTSLDESSSKRAIRKASLATLFGKWFSEKEQSLMNNDIQKSAISLCGAVQNDMFRFMKMMGTSSENEHVNSEESEDLRAEIRKIQDFIDYIFQQYKKETAH